MLRPSRPRDKFLDGLLAALRVAAGLPIDLTVRWSSGPDGGITLETGDPTSIGWVTHLLLPTYPPASWAESRSPGPGPAGWEAVGRAAFGPDRPHQVATEFVAPWSDSVTTALRLLPGGTSLAWRLRPLGASPATGWPVDLVPQPAGFRVAPPPTAIRRVVDAAADRAFTPQWDLRLELHAADRRAGEAAGRLVAAAARADAGNGVRWRARGRLRGRYPPPIVLALAEVAALFPSPDLRLPYRIRGPGTESRTVPLGRSVSGRTVGLPVESGQGRHALFLGETGMGKSSALLQCAISAAELGGLAFFDPVGDTSRRLLDRLAPALLRRVVWISPSVSPVSVNALAAAGRPGPMGERALAELVQAMRRVRAGRYADSPFWGPRVEEMVHLALRAAAKYPRGTLRDGAALLASAAGRISGVPPGAEAAVRDLVDRVRSRPEEVDGARRVLEEIVRTPVLARMLATPEVSFSVGSAVRAGQIVLITGDAPDVGEACSRLLLSLHLALLWTELLSDRVMGKVFVVADEIQWYANEAAIELWRLGRRFNIHVWAATQSLASLPDPVREAALTNSADLVVFRGSPDDARELARWVAEVPVESTTHLRRGEAAVLIEKGGETDWVRFPFESDRPRPERWREVWERCRPLWGPTDVGRDPVGQDRPFLAGTSEENDGVRRVLAVLWAGMASEPGSQTLTVALDELRAEVDPGGGAVRTAGQRLAAAGHLETAESASGRTWTLRRSDLADLLGTGLEPDELAEAELHWRRLVGRRNGSSPRKGL